MKKLKILSGLLLTSVPVAIFATSCSSNNNQIVFALKYSTNSETNQKFVDKLKTQFDTLKQETKFKDKNFNFVVKSVDDNSSKRDLVLNGSANFAFLTAGSIVDEGIYSKLKPMVQTMTTAFKFDTDMSKVYVDGSESDPLRTIANQMQKASFGETYQYPFDSWKDNAGTQPNYNWNGIRYNDFYNEEKVIDGYRGMIILSGTDEQITNATNYWNSKDWNSFRNLGIILGDSSSQGNYKLQEKLIRTHFNLGNDWTIASDKAQNQNKYESDPYGTEKIGKNENYVISFTDEASFAWTNNNLNKESYRPRTGAKLKILTVTNPYLYDIGVFSSNIDSELAKLISQSMVNLYENKDNNYGDGLGYNGYSIINNFKTDVLDRLN